MQYFIISNDVSELGYQGNIAKFIGDCPRDAKQTIQTAWDLPLIGNLHIPEGILISPGAKWADILSIMLIGPSFLAISKKFSEVLCSCEFPPPSIEVFPLPVLKKSESRDYHIFIAGPPALEFVDYNRSQFARFDTTNMTQTPITVKDANDFGRLRSAGNDLTYIICTSTILDPSKITYDTFRLSRGFGDPYHFVSERIVEKALKADLYGVVFHPINEMPFKFV
jgi:hypothetical protein